MAIDSAYAVRPSTGGAEQPLRLSTATITRLQTELQMLEHERRELARASADARGDAADQAWFSERDVQLIHLDVRIERLADTLRAADIPTVRIDGDRVEMGVAVALRFDGDVAPETYRVGVMDEQEDDVTVVTPTSPLGRQLLGAQCGDSVSYDSPRGRRHVTVVSIG